MKKNVVLKPKKKKKGFSHTRTPLSLLCLCTPPCPGEGGVLCSEGCRQRPARSVRVAGVPADGKERVRRPGGLELTFGGGEGWWLRREGRAATKDEP